MEKKLEEKDEYISSLQEKIKNLISEKDALTGRNKSLEQEKELFKVRVTYINIFSTYFICLSYKILMYVYTCIRHNTGQ